MNGEGLIQSPRNIAPSLYTLSIYLSIYLSCDIAGILAMTRAIYRFDVPLQSYSMLISCSYFGDGTCRFGDACSQAHSDAELVEWKDRFEQRKQSMSQKKQAESYLYADKLTEKILNAESKEAIVSACGHIESPRNIAPSIYSGYLYIYLSKFCVEMEFYQIVGLLYELPNLISIIVYILYHLNSTLGIKRIEVVVFNKGYCGLK